MKTGLLCSIILITSALVSAQQTIKVPESWDKLAAKADEVANINLDRKMLAFAAKFMDRDEGDNDAEAKQLISKLNGIYVRTLEFKQPMKFSDADVEPIRAQLRGSEWSNIVNVNSKAEQERVDIYVKTVDGKTMGLVILAQEPTSLAFIDLDGPINPDDVGKLAGNFGIPKDIQAKQKASTNSSAPKPDEEKK